MRLQWDDSLHRMFSWRVVDFWTNETKGIAREEEMLDFLQNDFCAKECTFDCENSQGSSVREICSPVS